MARSVAGFTSLLLIFAQGCASPEPPGSNDTDTTMSTHTQTTTDPPEPNHYGDLGLEVADYLLSQQDADGAIPDAPGWTSCNIDSNMEYALIGLAAAYQYSGDDRYLVGLEKGIGWLAAREEMSDPDWIGSWRYAYRSQPPYEPMVVPMGPNIDDVRGVDATSGLFAYLVYLHVQLSGDTRLRDQYEENVVAALDFVLDHNRADDGYFLSSWQQRGDEWRLWRFEYSADQADVYLGLQAGALLYREDRFTQAAQHLESGVATTFFGTNEGRFAIGRDEGGQLEFAFEGFNGIFPQGYVTWVVGESTGGQQAWSWLATCEAPDGSLSCYDDDPTYALTFAVYAMAATALDEPFPTHALDWFEANLQDPSDGGVRDTARPQSEKYSNVQGLSIVALTQFQAFAAE